MDMDATVSTCGFDSDPSDKSESSTTKRTSTDMSPTGIVPNHDLVINRRPITYPIAKRRPCHIEDLVDDVLVIILKHLSIFDRMRLERVCRRWQRISLNSWQNVRSLRFSDLYEMDEEFIDVRDCNKVLISLLKRAGTHLQSLDISDSFMTGSVMDFSERSYRALGKYCPNVIDLDLSYVALNNVHLQILAEYSSQITRLRLVRCFEDEPQPDVGLACIFQCMKSLEYIDLSMNETINGECFCALRNSLHSLVLNSCLTIGSRSLELMSQRCVDLRHLELYGCVHSLSIVLENLPNLETLNLNSCQGNDQLFQVMRARLGRVRNLDLGHSSSLVTDQVMAALSDGCPELERLNLSGKFGRVTSAGLLQLARCKRLKELDISWLESANDELLLAIARNGALESLHAHLCENITDIGVVGAVSCCSTLEFIDVTGCPSIDVECLCELSSVCAEKRHRLRVHVSGDGIDASTISKWNHEFFLAQKAVV